MQKETFLMENSIGLSPMPTKINNSQRKGIQVPRNEPLFAEITLALNGMVPINLGSPSISARSEMLVIRQDLRHMFLKGYLILMSYNLAVASGIDEYQYSNIQADLRPGVSSDEKLAIMLSYPIVVDAVHFTREELWLLIEMCCAYPTKRYGEANIYNNVALDEDQLCVVTSNSTLDLGQNPGYGSPEWMWEDLVTIAIKMDAMEDLREVVRDFRGVPAILRSVSELTSKRRFTLHYPLSYSVGLAVEEINMRNPFVNKDSGYYATTKCLVVDLVLGKMMEMSAFNIIEDIGALGVVGCPTGDALNSSILNGNLRGRGLKYENEKTNELLQEWRGVRGSCIPVGFAGILKDYVLKMVAEVRSGTISRLRPQLLFALPYSRCKNTTWSTIRGWRFPEFSMTDEFRQNQLVKAFSWVMGASKDLPKVCINGIGETSVQGLSMKEMKLLGMASGEYKLTMVRVTLDRELEPRMDEFVTGTIKI